MLTNLNEFNCVKCLIQTKAFRKSTTLKKKTGAMFEYSHIGVLRIGGEVLLLLLYLHIHALW